MRRHDGSRRCLHAVLPDLFRMLQGDEAEQMDQSRAGTVFLAGCCSYAFTIPVLLCTGKSERSYRCGFCSRGIIVEEIFLWYNIISES